MTGIGFNHKSSNLDSSPSNEDKLLLSNSQIVESASTLTALPTITISVADAIATEKPSGIQDVGIISVVRSGGDLSQLLKIPFTVTGTAKSGRDFISLSGYITFSADSGEAILDPTIYQALISISPIDDLKREGNETVTITLLPDPTKYTLVNNQATVLIVDNDIAPLTVQALNSQAVETTTETAPNYGDDFASITNSVTSGSDSDIATVVITPIDDPNSEATNQRAASWWMTGDINP